MNIGDKVCGQKIGVPFVGKIVFLSDPYHFLVERQCGDQPEWTVQYPDWKNGLVACVMLDQPVRTISKEEYEQRGGDPGFYDHLPMTSKLVHPTVDLVLLDSLLKVHNEDVG